MAAKRGICAHCFLREAPLSLFVGMRVCYSGPFRLESLYALILRSVDARQFILSIALGLGITFYGVFLLCIRFSGCCVSVVRLPTRISSRELRIVYYTFLCCFYRNSSAVGYVGSCVQLNTWGSPVVLFIACFTASVRELRRDIVASVSFLGFQCDTLVAYRLRVSSPGERFGKVVP